MFSIDGGTGNLDVAKKRKGRKGAVKGGIPLFKIPVTIAGGQSVGKNIGSVHVTQFICTTVLGVPAEPAL